MTATELIVELHKIIGTHGDLEVCAFIDDYGDSMGEIDQVEVRKFFQVGNQIEDQKLVIFLS